MKKSFPRAVSQKGGKSNNKPKKESTINGNKSSKKNINFTQNAHEEDDFGFTEALNKQR
jgi:hypothetical protein